MGTFKVGRRGVFLLAGAAVIGSITGAVTNASAPAGQQVDEPVVDLSSITGNGERLIIVVGGLRSSRIEAEKAATALSFGDMQGFYVDSTDNYTLTGFYEQVSPDALPVSCDDLASPAIDCPSGSEVFAIQPVAFQYQDVDAISGLLAKPTAGSCGAMGRPPCIARRLSVLVDGPPFRLATGRFMLLSAFRTLDGAEQFAELARDRGAEVVAIRVVKTGGQYVGLGQEANPDGRSGPLLAPLADPDTYQK